MKILRVNTRGQVSLGSLAQYELYLATVDAKGVITLTPGTVKPITKEER